MAANPVNWQPMRGGPMSVEEYLILDENALDEKYEYFDGIARLMSGGSGEHDLIAHNIRVAIEQHFSDGPCFVRGSDMKVRIGTKANSKEHFFYPDVTISCSSADERRGTKTLRSPRMVIEVLSPSTASFDRGAKRRAYQGCPTIQEIVLVDQFSQFVEIYRRDETNGNRWDYVVYQPEQDVSLTSIGISLSMSEIYRRINFNEPLVEED